ncbi:SdpA family antimicrobial peptide system protein [Pedobacter psychrotolerans]|uniref:SdpA family antimicrobial peptide system protein n=1 Tax=Pedobacter psychrotolerans TaxID=1843235 RepID=UPI003F997D76
MYKYILTTLCSILCAGLLILTVFFSSLPSNPMNLALKRPKAFLALVPEGWAFFTRSPREAQILIYACQGNKLTLLEHRHSSYRNLLGLNRRVTKLFGELQFIKRQIKDYQYADTKFNYQSGKIQGVPGHVVEVKNQMDYPILMGQYVVVYQKAIPWSWYRSNENIDMPAKIIKLNITK